MTPWRLCLLVLLCLLCMQVRAEGLLVIKPRETELTRTFIATLQEQHPELEVLSRQIDQLPDLDSTPLAVTMGVEALQWRLTQASRTPTIATYVTLDQLAPGASYPDHVQILLASARPERQLLLAQLLIPRLQTVGLLHSSGQRWQLPLWRQAARQQGLGLVASEVHQQRELLRGLSRVLDSSEVLIGIDDPAIYNATTIKSLLLTSYNRNRVLIGPSAPFIAAGSLSTTYSSPRDMAMSVHQLFQQPWQNGALNYPQHYSVLSNPQVARSLGLPPPDDAQLLRLIRMRESQTP